ncbi:outer membrane beta-barrel protein [Chitinophaga nivalis]|uniref:Outer membrane beta-barrel protein n=1 Tax=Chitinophaga nivalis TaxID=2991709 RepID=A0ABT3INH4_9BACT|nr:outer membrane beta-barrel protein [Chitinophaga nivalis]MCW3464805.1 outer membrane beta-barrel protein [Chitinophaga nivalis]MCW3485504.1 outer membrane beta-barrel protein [Chitinophaga nivalis]
MKINSLTIHLACLLLLFTTTAAAQSTAPYLIFKTTYGFAGNPQKINEAEVTVQGKAYTKGIYGSYGKGVNFQLGIGKMINPNFGFEVNVEYLMGQKMRAYYNGTEDSINGDVTDYARSVLFKPLIVIRNSGDLLSIYTKLGLAIAVNTRRHEHVNVQFITDAQGIQLVTTSQEQAKAKVGFSACFGLSFRVAEAISLFTEINGQMLSLSIDRGHYTQNTINGVDQLPQLTTSQKSWVYRKSGFFDAPNDPNQPEPRLYNPANASYIGIGVGILYHF